MNLLELPGGLMVLDLDRRTYAGLGHEGDYWHLIRPARKDDALVLNQRVRVGELTCSCPGGTYRGSCWRLDQARAFELIVDDVAWGLVPSPFVQREEVPA